jgi:hypothetical protein
VSTKPEQWEEAKRRCRLSDDDIRKAKELGMQPRSLIKNIPSPSQQWKVSVRAWVRSLHAKKFGVRATPPAAPPVAPPAAAQPAAGPKAAERQPVVEFRNREHPWPDRPRVPDLIVDLNDDFDEPWEQHGPPDESDIAETSSRMIRRQYLFRWGAQSVAIAMSRLPEVRKVAAFGAIAQPLRMQVPRFGQYRRYRIEVPHECADLDLAVWLDDFSRLKELKRALGEGLGPLQDTPYGGIAHHQVDVHVFDAGSGLYRGRVCIFGQCPKPGKRECWVPNCGEKPFLQQFDESHFNDARFEREPKVTLFDRADGFLVRPPRVEDAKPAIVIELRPYEDDSDDGAEVPF